jgi:hypothetical protein
VDSFFLPGRCRTAGAPKAHQRVCAQSSPKISGDLRTAKVTNSNGTLLIVINATQLIGVPPTTCGPIMSANK